MNLTSEQVEAIDLFALGENLKIHAFAGAGKTSTLEQIAHSTRRCGQYLAFNRAIVQEARGRFSKGVRCSTIHGLAYNALRHRYAGRIDKLSGKLTANQLAELLRLKCWKIDSHFTLAPRSLGFMILDTITRYAQSGDAELTEKHVSQHGSLAYASADIVSEVTEFSVRWARHIWTRMEDPYDPIPLGHDGYLKLWALSEPNIPGDFILLDEAQDTNPVVLKLLRNQSAQLVCVGDEHQQIHEWRGAINAMKEIDAARSAYLTMSFRFGTSIAHAANRILSLLGERRPIVGNPTINSQIGPTLPEAILARTNASTILAIVATIEEGKRPHLVGGVHELVAMLEGVADLKAGRPSYASEFIGFNSWQQVSEFARSDEGKHLQMFVNLVSKHGERRLLWALGCLVDEAGSDVVISTAHRAKGREWKRVRLMDDFLTGSIVSPDGRDWSMKSDAERSELRLFYVAITRAKHELDLPSSVLPLLGLKDWPREIPRRRFDTTKFEFRDSDHVAKGAIDVFRKIEVPPGLTESEEKIASTHPVEARVRGSSNANVSEVLAKRKSFWDRLLRR